MNSATKVKRAIRTALHFIRLTACHPLQARLGYVFGTVEQRKPRLEDPIDDGRRRR